jgi:sugar diacid utilization regulator
VCLEDLSSFEYLALRSDATAQRLGSPAITDFLAEDAAKGGTLTRALLAYVEADLNVSSAPEQLSIHPNTAHYRLARIAEKTGLDLRNVSHLMELLAAGGSVKGGRSSHDVATARTVDTERHEMDGDPAARSHAA